MSLPSAPTLPIREGPARDRKRALSPIRERSGRVFHVGTGMTTRDPSPGATSSPQRYAEGPRPDTSMHLWRCITRGHDVALVSPTRGDAVT